jgi:hypothetical protein
MRFVSIELVFYVQIHVERLFVWRNKLYVPVGKSYSTQADSDCINHRCVMIPDDPHGMFIVESMFELFESFFVLIEFAFYVYVHVERLFMFRYELDVQVGKSCSTCTASDRVDHRYEMVSDDHHSMFEVELVFVIELTFYV